MAWSSFAHLPTSEAEYLSILIQLEDGMSTKEVDQLIAKCKGKEKVSHHYRSNLVRLGLFDICDNKIVLYYDPHLLSDKKELGTVLKSALKRSKPIEVLRIKKLISELKTYDVNEIAEVLFQEYPCSDKQNLIRWIRPIVFLNKIVDIYSPSKSCSTNTNVSIIKNAKYLQNGFLSVAKRFDNLAALEQVELEIKKGNPMINIVPLLDELLNDVNIRFKIELLMLPSWATNNKSYRIGQDIYTHIKIKSNLLDEGEQS